MKESDRLLYRENHSSWRRFWMLTRFYWPRLRGPLFALLSLTVFLIFSIGVYLSVTGHNAPYGVYLSVSLLILLSPVTLLLRDFRAVGSQLPVTATEKLGTLLFYFWIVFPWSIYAVGALAEFAVKLATGTDIMQSFLNEYSPSGVSYFVISGSGTLVMMSIIACELYHMLRARGNRAGVALVSVLVGLACYMLLVAMASFILGVIVGYRAAVTGEEIDLTLATRQVFMYVLPSVSAMLMLVAAVYLIKLHKHLNNSGF